MWRICNFCGFCLKYSAHRILWFFFSVPIEMLDNSVFIHFVFGSESELNVWIYVNICRECECDAKKNFMNDINGKFSPKSNNTQAMHKICAMWVEYNRSEWKFLWWTLFYPCALHTIFNIDSCNIDGRAREFSLRIESKQCDRGYLFNPSSNWYRTT